MVVLIFFRTFWSAFWSKAHSGHENADECSGWKRKKVSGAVLLLKSGRPSDSTLVSRHIGTLLWLPGQDIRSRCASVSLWQMLLLSTSLLSFNELYLTGRTYTSFAQFTQACSSTTRWLSTVCFLLSRGGLPRLGIRSKLGGGYLLLPRVVDAPLHRSVSLPNL